MEFEVVVEYLIAFSCTVDRESSYWRYYPYDGPCWDPVSFFCSTDEVVACWCKARSQCSLTKQKWGIGLSCSVRRFYFYPVEKEVTALDCPHAPLSGRYSQWQHQTVVQREAKCHAPKANQNISLYGFELGTYTCQNCHVGGHQNILSRSTSAMK